MAGVILEIGRSKVFATAAEWPGWCRSRRGDEAAIAALADAAPRYAVVAARAGLAFPAGLAEEAAGLLSAISGVLSRPGDGAPGRTAAALASSLRLREARLACAGPCL